VISWIKSELTYRSVNYRRALGCLLVLLIAYGTTVAHSHGRVSLDRSGIADISDAGGSQSSDKGDSHQRECSMCQFQQQLFNGLVHAPLFAITPSAQIASVDTPTVVFPSISTTPRRGRAPPLACLL
jgi:hypothetical protein